MRNLGGCTGPFSCFFLSTGSSAATSTISPDCPDLQFEGGCDADPRSVAPAFVFQGLR
jgi:hypothetical protein